MDKGGWEGSAVSHTLSYKARTHCILIDQQHTMNLSLSTSLTLMHDQSHLATISKPAAGFLFLTRSTYAAIAQQRAQIERHAF